jgi:hypothetical protein
MQEALEKDRWLPNFRPLPREHQPVAAGEY